MLFKPFQHCLHYDQTFITITFQLVYPTVDTSSCQNGDRNLLNVGGCHMTVRDEAGIFLYWLVSAMELIVGFISCAVLFLVNILAQRDLVVIFPFICVMYFDHFQPLNYSFLFLYPPFYTILMGLFILPLFMYIMYFDNIHTYPSPFVPSISLVPPYSHPFIFMSSFIWFFGI
jgi:hypothetical protein